MDSIEKLKAELVSILSKEVDFKPEVFFYSTDKKGRYDDSKTILSTTFRYSRRFAYDDPATVQITYSNDKKQESEATLFSCQLSEFPACCGKAILYNLKLYFGHTSPKTRMYKEFSNKVNTSLCEAIFEFIGEVLVGMKYSSCDFIVSDKENTLLYEIAPELEMLERGCKFRNRRNEYDHTCVGYTMTFKELSIKEMKDREYVGVMQAYTQ